MAYSRRTVSHTSKSALYRLLALAVSLEFASVAGGQVDFYRMVDDIEANLDESLVAYQSGAYDRAQELATAAYFSVFENMEGPIRINISQAKNFEFELKFSRLRRLIEERVEFARIDELVQPLKAELRKLPPQLEGGHVIVAEAAVDPVSALIAGDPELEALFSEGEQGLRPEEDNTALREDLAEAPSDQAMVQTAVSTAPYWLETASQIRKHLVQAVASYRDGDLERAQNLVLEAQYSGYKNRMLETAIRQQLSAGTDAEINLAFSRLSGAMAQGEAASNIEERLEMLLLKIEQSIPGLAVPERVAVSPVPENARVDDEAELEMEIGKLLVRVQYFIEGQKASATGREAVNALKAAYFEHCEESGLIAWLERGEAGRGEALVEAYGRVLRLAEEDTMLSEIRTSEAYLRLKELLSQHRGSLQSESASVFNYVWVGLVGVAIGCVLGIGYARRFPTKT